MLLETSVAHCRNLTAIAPLPFRVEDTLRANRGNYQRK